jgi:type II secretory pathway pseudopilin PulG
MKITKNKTQISNFKNNGFTLIEIVMIIVIASIAIPTLLLLLGQQAKYGVDAEIRVTEINLAQQLMEEIKSKCWDDSTVAANCVGPGTGGPLGINGGENRTACTGATTDPFDDVDDYNGYSEPCVWGGTSYTRSAQVCYVNAPPPGTALNTCVAGPTNYKRISITVTGPNSQSVELVTVVTNY